jgi:hypothetical protein
LKRFALVLLALVLAVLVLCLPVLLRLDNYRAQIASTLSQKTNRKVVIGRLEAVIFPPAMRLREIAVMAPDGNGALLQIDEVLAPVGLSGLVRGHISPQSFLIRGWTATLHRHQDGSWAWDEWLDPTAQATQGAGWPLSSITVERGECHLIDPYGPGPQEFIFQIHQGVWESARRYFSLDGVVASLPTPVNFLFQGSGQFIANTQWTGVLTFSDESRSWKTELKALPGRIDATGHADQWRFDTAYAFLKYYARLPVAPPASSPASLLGKWESTFKWENSTLIFSQSADVAGGRGELTGTFRFQAPVPSAQVDLALQGVKLQPVESAITGSSPLEGTATGLAHLELQLTSSSWTSMNGQGAMEIKDGRYLLPPDTARSLSKAHTMHYLEKKFPGFVNEGLAFSTTKGRWHLQRGVVNFDDVFSNLGDIQTAMAGSYDLMHNGIDAYVRMQVHEKNVDLLKELPAAYVDLGQRPPRIQAMHGHIQGTPGEWHLRATRFSKVPPAVMNKLSKAIRGK